MPRASHVGQEVDVPLLEYPGPDDLNVPSDDFNDYTLAIYGQKGKGKTTTSADFPNTLTLMLEPFRKGLRIRQLSLRKISSRDIQDGAPDVWQQIIRTTPVWIDDPTIDRISFDSIDLTYQTCQESVCARNKILVPGDAGRDSANIWIQIREEFAAYMNTLKDQGMQITMLSHVKEREETDLEGGKLKFNQPSCPPACLAYIRQAADIVLQIGTYNEKRALMVRDPVNAAFVSNGAQGRFMQPDGKPINVFEIPDVSNSGKPGSIYNTIVDAFNNKVWDIDTPADKRTISPPKPKKGPTRH